MCTVRRIGGERQTDAFETDELLRLLLLPVYGVKGRPLGCGGARGGVQRQGGAAAGGVHGGAPALHRNDADCDWGTQLTHTSRRRFLKLFLDLTLPDFWFSRLYIYSYI